MVDRLLPLALGFSAGILSAWGVGGGTLLLLLMTLFMGIDRQTAQGINLLYFLPTAALGLVSHRKNSLLDGSVIRPAALWGTGGALAGAVLAAVLPTETLRHPFGLYLLFSCVMLFRDSKNSTLQKES